MSRLTHVGFISFLVAFAVVFVLNFAGRAAADMDTQQIQLGDAHTTYSFTENPFFDQNGNPAGTSLLLDMESDISTMQFVRTNFQPYTGTAPNAPAGWFQFSIQGIKTAPTNPDPLHGPRFSADLSFGTIVAASGSEVYDKNAVIGAPGVDLWSHMYSSISATNMIADGQAIGGYSEYYDRMSGTTTVTDRISVPVTFIGPDPAGEAAVFASMFHDGAGGIPEPTAVSLLAIAPLLIRRRRAGR